MKFPVQQRKEMLLEQFTRQRAAIQEVINRLPISNQEQVFLGIWSALDLLAHLTGWDEANREAIAAVQAGRLPAFYAYRSKDWSDYNAVLVGRFRTGSAAEMLAANRASHQALVERVVAISPNDFARDFGVRYRGYRVTVERLVQSETADEGIHLEQLLAFTHAGLSADRRAHPVG